MWSLAMRSSSHHRHLQLFYLRNFGFLINYAINIKLISKILLILKLSKAANSCWQWNIIKGFMTRRLHYNARLTLIITKCKDKGFPQTNSWSDNPLIYSLIYIFSRLAGITEEFKSCVTLVSFSNCICLNFEDASQVPTSHISYEIVCSCPLKI